MFQRMDHAGLSVKDMEKAILFYQDIIGMKKVFDRSFETPLAEIIGQKGARAKSAPFPTNDCQNLITAWEALAFPEKVGEKVVIIGGGSVGCETAEYLAGKNVEIEYLGMKGQGPDIEYKVLNKTDHTTQCH
jgi:catechol 2,3-dioxygenase-like lactoylglutathione lyase family enzyme